MVERNMIREGFISNTLAPDLLTFSGSQLLNEQQQTFLADGNISVAAVTVSATEDINVTADLGARWKLNRIELYTDDLSSSNIIMEISDNNLDYYPVTMTGSPNLYVGDILDSTVSGAPRYIRYQHTAVSDLDVFEWKAINDDTLVDFGTDGDQTSVEITDAPVGRPSDSVTELQLFNRFTQPGTAFVFIENTGGAADELFEIATSQTGPWFGRGVQLSVQPNNTPLSSGIFNGTRAVTASGYFINWNNEVDLRGWSGDNGAIANITPGIGAVLSSNGSSAPRFSNFGLYTGITDGDAGGDSDAGTPGYYNINKSHIALRAQFYDRVRVRLKGPQLSLNDVTEGPRLFWRAADGPDNTSWPVTHSTLALNPGLGFSEDSQDFIFDVGSNPTWSGSIVVRGLSVQPYTTVTGIGGLQTEFEEIQVYNSSGKEMVVLEESPTISGSKPHLVDESLDGTIFRNAVLSLNTRFLQPCIVTKVTMVCTNTTAQLSGAFLARFNEEDPGFAFPDRYSNNFTCKNVVRNNPDSGVSENTLSWYVRWRAAPGDFVGFSQENTNVGIGYRDNNLSGYASAWQAPGIFGSVGLSSANSCQNGLNDIVTGSGSWERLDDTEVQIWAETVSIGDFIPTGTYETPVFDAGTLPGLLSASFVSIEEGGSSIDSRISEAFKTIRGRASDTPPRSSLTFGMPTSPLSPVDPTRKLPDYLDPIYIDDLGFTNQNIGPYPTVPTWLNEEISSNAGNEWLINFGNQFVTSRENPNNNTMNNVGSTLLHHKANDELWVMNVLISGTYPNDLRPIWDVYDPVNFDYIRTQHVTGQIGYAYDSGNATIPEIFEPAGFIYDEEFEEIYIFNRENSFFINAASYFAIVIDLEGNYKRASFRSGILGEPNENWWNNVSSVTFDGTFFYFLTDSSAGVSNGSHLMVAKRGDIADPTSITVVGTQNLSTIAGFETLLDDPQGQQIVWVDGLLYILFANSIDGSDDFAFREHELHALKIDFVDDVPTTYTKITLEDPFGLSSTGGVRVRALDVRRDGFTNNFPANEFTTLLTFRTLKHDSGMVYDSVRDQFTVLQTRSARWGDDYDPRRNKTESNSHVFNNKSHSFMLSFAANFIKSIGETPVVPQVDDPVWGSVSGTLEYQSKQSDSVLFPTGRYGQLKYTLNAGTGQSVSPILTRSQLDQGIRVGNVPASGTTSIFLRTNLPEDQVLGDLQGRLKVFWELPE